MKIYFNHSIFENASNADVMRNLMEIRRLSTAIVRDNGQLWFHNQFWNLQLQNGTLYEFIIQLRKTREDWEQLQTIVESIMNAGPHFQDGDHVPGLQITPYVSEYEFAGRLLHQCYVDTQGVVLSLQSEQKLIHGEYQLSVPLTDLIVENVIGQSNLLQFLDSQRTFETIEDVFEAIEQSGSRIRILESARKSAKKHHFRDAYQDVFHAILGLASIELPLLIEKALEESRIMIFKEHTGFDIAKESGVTMGNRKYRTQREFVIPERGKELFEWHVKVDGNHTRIHYFVDKENEIVYIGHCGAHLGVSSYRS